MKIKIIKRKDKIMEKKINKIKKKEEKMGLIYFE